LPIDENEKNFERSQPMQAVDFLQKILPFAVCAVISGTHFGDSRTSPLQERKLPQAAASFVSPLTKVHLRYF